MCSRYDRAKNNTSDTTRIKINPTGGSPSTSATLNHSYYISNSISTYPNGLFVNYPSKIYIGSIDGYGIAGAGIITLDLNTGVYAYFEIYLLQTNESPFICPTYKISNFFYNRNGIDNILTGTNATITIIQQSSVSVTYTTTPSTISILISGYHVTDWKFMIVLSPHS